MTYTDRAQNTLWTPNEASTQKPHCSPSQGLPSHQPRAKWSWLLTPDASVSPFLNFVSLKSFRLIPSDFCSMNLMSVSLFRVPECRWICPFSLLCSSAIVWPDHHFPGKPWAFAWPPGWGWKYRSERSSGRNTCAHFYSVFTQEWNCQVIEYACARLSKILTRCFADHSWKKVKTG